MSYRRPVLAVFIASSSLLVASDGVPQAAAQEIGTAAAVNPSAQARIGGAARTIVIGQSIAHRERIQTTSAGSVQLIFLDKTSMTVGPNSDLAIDEYVYDPASNTGRLAASLSKGVMRFVGGQISHAGNAQISTPNAVVGIRGGVGIFHTTSVYVGYGLGEVRSGASTVELSAGDYTQTPGGGAPPSPPGPPPPGFLQTVLATLQSRSGQGGGAPASDAAVNRARTVASGSPRGNIADGGLNALNRSIQYTTETFAWFYPTLITTVERSRIESGGVTLLDGGGSVSPTDSRLDLTTRNLLTQTSGGGGSGGGGSGGSGSGGTGSGGGGSTHTLVGYTGGMFQSVGRNGALGQNYPVFGVLTLQVDANGSNAQANFNIFANNSSQNALQTGNIQFGSTTSGDPSGRVTVNGIDQWAGTADGLAPATTSSGKPRSEINDRQLTQHSGVFVQIVPGSQLSNAISSTLGVRFCDCEYTRWGLWDSQTARPGPSNASIDERGRLFWVAGRLPSVGDVPTTGTATYDGHAIANIRNGNQSYIAGGSFQNVVNFGNRSGSVTVTGLDSTNYSGRTTMSGNDPRLFTGTLSGGNRTMALTGNFFAGSTSAVGEMGGVLQLSGPSYSGGGIFAGRTR